MYLLKQSQGQKTHAMGLVAKMNRGAIRSEPLPHAPIPYSPIPLPPWKCLQGTMQSSVGSLVLASGKGLYQPRLSTTPTKLAGVTQVTQTSSTLACGSRVLTETSQKSNINSAVCNIPSHCSLVQNPQTFSSYLDGKTHEFTLVSCRCSYPDMVFFPLSKISRPQIYSFILLHRKTKLQFHRESSKLCSVEIKRLAHISAVTEKYKKRKLQMK